MSLCGLTLVTEKFLSSSTPEVLCIRGAWGIGKTFAWKQAIEQARKAGTLPLDSYAYVSLFGLNSLDELRQSIFNSTVDKNSAGLDASLETLKDYLEGSKSLGRWILTKTGAFAAHSGALNKYIGNVGPALYLSIRNRVICIDDSERRGEKLKVGDVLGLISMLKEQRGCKVVLLLNDKAIKDGERDDFDSYMEKVVDISVTFDPSPADSIRIAFPDRNGIHGRTAALCVKLGIKNIRILRKISSFVANLVPSLVNFDPSVLDQAISTVVFLCWVVYDPKNAPSLDYLRERTDWDLYIGERRKTLTPEMKAWEHLLRDYGFGHIDNFDNALLDGIQSGLFDREKITQIADSLHKSAVAKEKYMSFHRAWARYHGSFDDNQDTVLDAIYTSFEESFEYLSLANVDETIIAFKDLGRPDQASELLHLYVDNIRDPKGLEEGALGFGIKDPEIIHAIKEKQQQLANPKNAIETLVNMARSDNYGSDDLVMASTLTASDMEKLFRSLHGEEHRLVIKWCLGLTNRKFNDEVTAASANNLSASTREALQAIAGDSLINRRRVAGLLANSN